MGIKAWITVNGNHIPIMDGESKMAAVGRFIKGKRDIARNRNTIYDIVDKANPALKKYAPAKAKDYKVPTIKGFKTKKELDRRYNEAYNKGEDLRDSYSERLQPLKDMPNKWDKEASRIHRQYKQAFMSKYKLKEDKLPKHRQTPVSRIRVDVSEFRNAHGKLPGSQRVGGSTRGTWAFKLGNETVFINDTYTGAKTKALKEASRRGLHSIKVLS